MYPNRVLLFSFATILWLTTLSVFAQNWAPFPLNQIGYYTYGGNLPSSSPVQMIVMDSIESSGNQHVHRFGQHLELALSGTCQLEDSLRQTPLYGYPELVKPLTWRDDTIWYEPSNSLGPQVFLVPQAGIGDSWGVNLGGLVVNDSAFVTCSGVEERTFFGITDSVRIFDIQADHGHPAEGLEMVLSKNYGLLVYSEVLSGATYGRVGFEQNGQTYGYAPPEIEDYLIYSPGDVLLWDHTYTADPSTGTNFIRWYRDSITAVQTQGDTFRYTYDRTVLHQDGLVQPMPNQERVFPLVQFRALVNAPLRWVGFSNNFVCSGASADEIILWRASGHYRQNEPGAPSQEKTIAVFHTFHGVLDRSDCSFTQPSDLQSAFNLSTYGGLVSHTNFSSVNAIEEERWTLVGGRFSGAQQGNIDLPVGIHQPTWQPFSVYPNPTKGLVRVDLPQSDSSPLRCTVHALTGQVVHQGPLDGRTLDLSHLPGGVYWMEIQTTDTHYRGKLIKAD